MEAVGVRNVHLNMLFKVSNSKKAVVYNVFYVPKLVCNEREWCEIAHRHLCTYYTSRCNSDSSSDEEIDEDLVIPQTSDVYYDVVEGTPGLQINTRNTSRWTPIACRTRSKSKLDVARNV